VIASLLARGEIAVIGLGRSGIAAARLIAREGGHVYASDAGASAAVEAAAEGLRREGINAAVPIVGELEVALHALRGVPYIAVTGTNGKSTVTALVAHLLQAVGRNAVAAGNIGLALSDVALQPTRPDWLALEISSFQLHDTPGIAPAVGVLTNLSPDHLDRYPSVEAYYADKQLLYRNATPRSVWVVNADDARARSMAEHAEGSRVAFSRTDRHATAHYAAAMDSLVLFKEPFIHRAALPLLGWHNVENTLAAVLAVMAADESLQLPEARAALAEAVQTFHGLPHRLELVADAGGVRWINDSKATNVSSARVAIEAMTQPAVVLLGGKHKGEPYTALLEPLRAHARLVIAFGEAAPLIAGDLAAHVPLEQCGSSFEEVMQRARAAAQPGDAVLLAPACSSFDMFTNYEARGDAFRQLARQPA